MTESIIEAVKKGRDAISTAITEHIYDFENGQAPEPDCRFVEARDAISAAADSIEKHGAFTYLEMEAALCVWECINEWTDYSDETARKDWVELRNNVGSVELRHASMPIGQWCLKVYDICVADNRDFFDGIAYDWEVIPMILKHARDADGPVINPDRLPDPGTIADKVMKEHRNNEWELSARMECSKQWCYADLLKDHPERTRKAMENGEDPAEFVRWLGEKYGLIPASEW